MSIINYLDDMALAIKEKSGYEGKMKYSEMPEKIRELAFEDPMKEYEDNSVLLKKGNLFIGENSNVAILDLGEPEQGKPTYNRFDLHPYYEGEQTSGETVAVINDSGNVYSLNTEIDNINSSSDGSAYTIKYGNENKPIEVVRTNFNSSHGILFGENGYTCEVPRYNSGETAIVKFDSSGLTCEMIYGTNGNLFYEYVNSSGNKFYEDREMEDGKTYVLHAELADGSAAIKHFIEAPNGFAFITSSGANQTYDGYNYIQFFDETGEATPYEIEEGKYELNYNYSLNRWEMREYEAPTPPSPVENSGYYYISFDSSTGDTQYNQIANSGVVYLKEYGNYEWLINEVEYNKTYFCSTNCGRSLSELSTGIFIIDDNGYPSQIYDETSIDPGDVFTVSSGKLYKQQYINEVTLYSYNGKSFDAMEEGLFYISDDSGSIGYYLNPEENGVYEYKSEYPCLTQVQYGVKYISETGSSDVYVNEGSCYQYMGNGSFSDLPAYQLIYIDSCEESMSHTSLQNGIYSYAGGLNFTQINLPTKGNPTEFTYNDRTYQITDITPNAAV